MGGAHVSGTTPFRWDAAPFAASYTLEVYKNNDLTFSSTNRVVSVSVKTTAYAPTTPLPAASTNYLWRVRRVDASGNPGPWSDAASFYSNGDAADPGPARPASGSNARRSLFEWTEVPGAASYQLVFGGDLDLEVLHGRDGVRPDRDAAGRCLHLAGVGWTPAVTRSARARRATSGSTARRLRSSRSLPPR